MADKKPTGAKPTGPIVTVGPPISFDEIAAIFERCEAQGQTIYVSPSLKRGKRKDAK